MHLVGFTIEIYYDARPYERQLCLGHSCGHDQGVLKQDYKQYTNNWTKMYGKTTHYTNGESMPSIIMKVHFNIVFPSMPKSSKWSLYCRFPHQNTARGNLQ